MSVSYTHLDVYKRQAVGTVHVKAPTFDRNIIGEMCIRDRVDCWEKKTSREGSDRTNWRSKAPEQHTVFTLHKTSGNLIINGFAEGR